MPYAPPFQHHYRVRYKDPKTKEFIEVTFTPAEIDDVENLEQRNHRLVDQVHVLSLLLLYVFHALTSNHLI